MRCVGAFLPGIGWARQAQDRNNCVLSCSLKEINNLQQHHHQQVPRGMTMQVPRRWWQRAFTHTAVCNTYSRSPTRSPHTQIGPALEEGFYYDCFMGDRSLGDADKELIEKRIESSIKENQRFERVVVTREEALAMFEENKFKVCD